MSPLHTAAKINLTKIVLLLLKSKPQLTLIDYKGNTFLHYIAMNNNLTILKHIYNHFEKYPLNNNQNQQSTIHSNIIFTIKNKDKQNVFEISNNEILTDLLNKLNQLSTTQSITVQRKDRLTNLIKNNHKQIREVEKTGIHSARIFNEMYL